MVRRMDNVGKCQGKTSLPGLVGLGNGRCLCLLVWEGREGDLISHDQDYGITIRCATPPKKQKTALYRLPVLGKGKWTVGENVKKRLYPN